MRDHRESFGEGHSSCLNTRGISVCYSQHNIVLFPSRRCGSCYMHSQYISPCVYILVFRKYVVCACHSPAGSCRLHLTAPVAPVRNATGALQTATLEWAALHAVCTPHNSPAAIPEQMIVCRKVYVQQKAHADLINVLGLPDNRPREPNSTRRPPAVAELAQRHGAGHTHG